MPDLIESARAILVSSEMRVQSSAQDIANSSTPAYKQQVAFAELLSQTDAAAEPATRFVNQFAQGKLTETNRDFDLAIVGSALMQVRDGEAVLYTRGGSFARGADGTLVDGQGRVVQQAGGGDLVVPQGNVEIAADGTALAGGLPIGAIGLFQPMQADAVEAVGGSAYRIPESAVVAADGSTVRQGYLESSNVVLSDEMVSLMTASRQAEGGARIAQIYDQLIGQGISTFGRGAQ